MHSLHTLVEDLHSLRNLHLTSHYSRVYLTLQIAFQLHDLLFKLVNHVPAIVEASVNGMGDVDQSMRYHVFD